MKIARHYETRTEQAIEAKRAKDQQEAEDQLKLLEPDVEKAANDGKYTLVYAGRLCDLAITMLHQLGYKVQKREREGNYPGDFSTIYDITWKSSE